jgi:hypothetical protein
MGFALCLQISSGNILACWDRRQSALHIETVEGWLARLRILKRNYLIINFLVMHSYRGTF